MERPKDKYRATYILFYCIGIISQVPNSFFITATEYWLYKFRDTSKPFDANSDDKTELQKQFTSNFSIVTTTCNIGFILVTVIFAKKIPHHLRMVISFIILAILFLLTIIFVLVDTDEWQRGFYGLTLSMGIFLTAAGAILNMSGVMQASKFPPEYLAAQLSGMAICGIVSALIQIISIANGASSVKVNALIYFTTGACMVVGTFIFYLIQNRSSDFYMEHAKIDLSSAMVKPSKEVYISVFKQVKYYLLSMTVLMASTSLVHPGLTVLIKSVNPGTPWNDKFFIPTVTFLIYNFFDFLGRETSPRIKKPENSLWTAIFSLLRCVFVPLLFFCNAQSRNHTSVGINSDTAYIIFMIIFAFSHGYLLNLSILLMPGKIPQEHMLVNFMLILVVMMVSQMVFSFLNVAMIKAL